MIYDPIAVALNDMCLCNFHWRSKSAVAFGHLLMFPMNVLSDIFVLMQMVIYAPDLTIQGNVLKNHNLNVEIVKL